MACETILKKKPWRCVSERIARIQSFSVKKRVSTPLPAPPCMARVYWEKVQEVDPSNAQAAAQLDAMELQDLTASAQALDARARSLMGSIGIETARGTYLQAMQKYELILSKAPSDARIRVAMDALKALFSDVGTGAPAEKPLSMDDMRLANLFPAQMQWYGSHPAVR